MPPKAKITEEMIVNAAFEIVREQGAEAISARSVSQRLGCSSQPVMYSFSRIDNLRKAVYEKADKFHTAYITDICGAYDNPMLEIGMLYIGFAASEKNLFRFLFQSDKFRNTSLTELVNAEELTPILEILKSQTGLDSSRAKDLFTSVFLPVHGYASMLANNSMDYDQKYISDILENTFNGLLFILKGDCNEKKL